MLSNSFDVYGNSPYEKLDFFSEEKNDQGGITYLSSKNTGFNNALFQKDEPPNFTQNLIPVRAESHAYVHAVGKIFASVIYAIIAFNSDGQPISWKSSIYVLDNNGYIKQKFTDLDIDAREAVVTDNGRLMAFAYGGIVSGDMDYLFTGGFKVINLDNASTIEDYSAKEEESILCPFVTDNKLIIESSVGYHPESVFYYRVYDSQYNIKWMKKFSYEERNSLVEILENGLRFETQGKTIIRLFERDFEKNNF
jgi:hypothetical protein